MAHKPQGGTTRRRALTVQKVIAETPDTCSLVLAVPDDLHDQFQYRPGQYLTFRIPSERTGSVARCYSLSSSPHVDTDLTVTVKQTVDGYGSAWLHANAKPGTTVDVLPPSGSFTPTTLDGDFLLFAGGSGITPVLSILKSVLANGQGRAALVYANRDDSSVIFAERLRELVQNHPGRLQVIHWLDSVQGVPTQPQVLDIAEALGRNRECFICGPARFMETVVAALTGGGWPARMLHTETFSSLTGNPFEDALLVETLSERTVPAQITVGGEHYDIDWPVDVPLVDHLLQMGLDVPYSCREGECGTCMGTVLKGRTRMLENHVLDDADIDSGSVLCCQALPAADEAGPIEIEFDA